MIFICQIWHRSDEEMSVIESLNFVFLRESTTEASVLLEKSLKRYLILAQPPLNIHRISCLNELAFDHNSIKKLMFSISSFNQIFYTHNKNICDQSGTFLWTIYIFWCSIDSKNVCFFCIYKNRKHMNFLAYFDFKDPLNVRNIFNI